MVKGKSEEIKWYPLNITDSRQSKEYWYSQPAERRTCTKSSTYRTVTALLCGTKTCFFTFHKLCRPSFVCSCLPPLSLFGCLLLNLQRLFAPGSNGKHKRISLGSCSRVNNCQNNCYLSDAQVTRGGVLLLFPTIVNILMRCTTFCWDWITPVLSDNWIILSFCWYSGMCLKFQPHGYPSLANRDLAGNCYFFMLLLFTRTI